MLILGARSGILATLLLPLLITASGAAPSVFPLAAAASAEPPTGPHPGLPFEISPTVGFMGGSALLGVRASMGNPVSLELSAEQIIGRTATLYPLTFNLAYDLSFDARAIPYGIVGGGLFLTVPLNTAGDETVSSVGVEFGGGLKYFVTNTIGIRFETKEAFTRIQNQMDNREELLIFQSTSLGVVFAFD
jgi:hypothetical protein